MVQPINLHGRLLLQNLYGKQGKVKSKKVFHLNTSWKSIIITKFYLQANKTNLHSILQKNKKKSCSRAAYQNFRQDRAYQIEHHLQHFLSWFVSQASDILKPTNICGEQVVKIEGNWTHNSI